MRPVEGHDPVAVFAKRKRAQQHRIHERKDCRVGPNPDCKRGDSGDQEPWPLQQAPNSDSNIQYETVHSDSGVIYSKPPSGPCRATVGAVYDRVFLLESTKYGAVIDRAYNGATVRLWDPRLPKPNNSGSNLSLTGLSSCS